MTSIALSDPRPACACCGSVALAAMCLCSVALYLSVRKQRGRPVQFPVFTTGDWAVLFGIILPLATGMLMALFYLFMAIAGDGNDR